MRLSWNEIRARAAKFSEDWKDARYERGETQTFYNEFFNIFDIPRRRVASYEEPVKKLGGNQGFIDLFWRGTLLVEQKSLGRDLKKAKQQAFDYFPNLKNSDLPRYILVCDFQSFELYDLDEDESVTFRLADLKDHIESFGFMLGVQKRTFKDQDPVNIEASELMGKLHDALKASGYDGHDLEQYLVRLLFCLFADDTGIFKNKDILLDYIQNRTQPDGSDLGARLNELFEVLNTEEKKRQTTLDEDLANFAYINGDLFAERLRTPSFNATMRTILIDACEFKWEAISPAIFGALFQSVMKRDERRALGAHYTTERNILKVIQPLFLDGLRAEFEHAKSLRRGRTQALEALHTKLSGLTFFDPACGCGNFLVIAYRELRSLEQDILRELYLEEGQRVLDIELLSKVNVDQFYGIEIGEFPARIAEVAMWMMDHIMNNRLSLEFGQIYARIPLKKSPHISDKNALAIDWNLLLSAKKCSYIFGNPPFVGHQYRTNEQQADMLRIWGNEGQVNRLDYVTCWFKKSADYATGNKNIRIAFVSTNSISQGEQTGILWPKIFSTGLSIQFAHRTFQWNSEARGAAAVHCIIVGMGFDKLNKRHIYDYIHARGEPHLSEVDSINGYLVDGPEISIPARQQPRSGLLKMNKGSQPTDGARLRGEDGTFVTTSNLILDADDRLELIHSDPVAEKWLRPYVGGEELISGNYRWCLWLKDANPNEIRGSRSIGQRLERVRAGRLKSPTKSVREFAKFPTLFTQDRQPNEPYLAIPEVSSETRDYIPMAVLSENIIASNKLQIIVGAPVLYFGILTSAMHMAWMRTVAGRLESRYSYSPAVYNSFPWPDLDDSKTKKLEELAERVLIARTEFPNNTLEDLYDDDAMPPSLRKAHINLDKYVDSLYRPEPFQFDRERVEHLFGLYEKLSSPLTAKPMPKGRRKKS